MSEMGDALMGSGVASGEHRAVEAAQEAISSPLLEEVSIEGALGVIVNVSGSDSMTLHEVNDATTVISEATGKDANIIFGAVLDNDLQDELRVTVIATGFNRNGRLSSLNGSKRFFDLPENPVADLEVPTFQRMDETTHGTNSTESLVEESSEKEKKEDLDVPAFLRRRVD